MTDVASLVIKADSTQIKKADSDLKNLNHTAGKTDKATEKMDKGFSSMAATLKRLAPLMAAAAAAYAGTQIVRVARETEMYTARLKTMTGSLEAANKEFDRLNQFARETPFTLKQSIDSFVKLKAMGLDPSERAMKAYGNTAAAMGKSMNQMIEAVADAATNEFERLKEFGIKAKQQGDLVSFTFQGVETTIKKSSENIQEYLLNIGETQFAGAMADQVNTIDGQLSNLTQSFDDLWREMGDGLGITKLIKDSLSGLADTVNWLTNEVKQLFMALKVNEFHDLTLEAERLTKVLNDYAKTTANLTGGSLLAMQKANEQNVKDFIAVKLELATLNQELGYTKTVVEEVTESVGEDESSGLSGGLKIAVEKLTEFQKALAEIRDLHIQDVLFDINVAYDEGSISLREFNKLMEKYGQHAEKAADETEELEKEVRKAEKALNPLEVSWNRVIERLDNGFADLWGNFVRGSIDAMDFVKEIAYDFLAEMLHAFTTKKIIASFGASFGMSGVAGAASSGVAGASSGGMTGIGDAFTLIKDGLFGTGLNTAITDGVNSAMQGTFGGTLNLATGTSGFLGSNVGMIGTGILANYLGDEIFGGYGGAGATIGSAIGSAFGPVGTLAGGFLGGAVGGLFGGSSSDTSPDLNIDAGFQPSRATSFGGNDAYGTIQSLFGGVAYSTQHDAFESQADATNFENAIRQSFVPYDDMIASVVGEEVTASIISGMNNFAINAKYEESGQWESGLKSIFEQRFNTIADLVGGEFNTAFDKVFSETGSYQQAVEAATQAVLRTSLIAEGYDVNRSQNKGSYTAAYSYFAEEFTKGISLATEEGMVEFTQELNNIVALISNARSSADYSAYFDSAVETNFSREKPKTSEKLLILGEYLMSVNAVLPALNQNMLELTIQGGMWAKNLAVISGGMDQFTAKASFYYENFFTETEQLQDTFDNSAKSIADFNAKFNQNITDKDSLRNLAESIDLTDEAGRKLYSSMLDLAPALVANIEAFEALNPIIDHTEELNAVREEEISFLQRAIDVWSDLKIGVGEFIDSIKLSDLSPLTRMEKFYEAQSQYLNNYNSALSGNQYAQENYTAFAEQYLTAGRDTYASSSNYEDIYNQVLSNAGTIDADLGSRIAQTQNAITVQTDNADVIDAINQLLVALVQTQSESADEITDAIRDTTDAILNQDNDPVSTLI